MEQRLFSSSQPDIDSIVQERQLHEDPQVALPTTDDPSLPVLTFRMWMRINMPVLIGATGNMPPATAVNYTTWIIVGFLSGYVVFRYWPELWKRYNCVLSGALDAGLAFMGVLIYFCLGLESISLSWWGE